MLVTMGVSLEVGARWIVPASDEFFRPDSVAGVHHIAGRTGRWVSQEFDVVVRINAAGFRDRERAVAKAPGTRRLVVLGDSMTEAFQVPLEATFTARLERGLGTPDRPVEVLNLGISALGPAQEYLVYRAYGARYAPDIVVLVVFTANDFRNSVATLEGKPYLRYPVLENGGLARTRTGDVRFTEGVAPNRVRQWARTELASYRFVRDRLLPALGGATAAQASDDLLALYREPLLADWRMAVDITLAMIAELDGAVRPNGARLLVALLPAPWDVDSALRAARADLRSAAVDWRRPERQAERWLREHGIVVAGLGDALTDAIAAGRRPYFATDGHLTPEGHALVADRLMAVVKGML